MGSAMVSRIAPPVHKTAVVQEGQFVRITATGVTMRRGVGLACRVKAAVGTMSVGQGRIRPTVVLTAGALRARVRGLWDRAGRARQAPALRSTVGGVPGQPVQVGRKHARVTIHLLPAVELVVQDRPVNPVPLPLPVLSGRHLGALAAVFIICRANALTRRAQTTEL